MNHRYLSGKFCDVLVINIKSGDRCYHDKVPLEHAKMLRSDISLDVKFLKFYKGKSQAYKLGETYEKPE